MKKYIAPTLVFLVATILAIYNIAGFPKMIGDEGIYVSQAYWLTHFGALGPYTYWYDHFPLGWAQIGAWQLLVGPIRFLGYSVLSARVFMGIILGGTTTLLYLLTHKLTDSKLLSLISSLIFITSALTLTFGRMVLLDNLAIFWFLLSLLILLTRPSNIKNLALSGLFLGISILTKESLLFFLPPYLFLAYHLNRDNPHSKFALLVSYTTIFFLLCFFPLLAILKHELLPHANQVSLLDTILFQASRGSGIPFWTPDSHFREMLRVWLSIDPILIIIGSVSTIATLIFGKTLNRIISIFTIFFTFFLIRGGQIYDFYIIPLLPLFALNCSLFLHNLASVPKLKSIFFFFPIILLVYISINSTYPWTTNATKSQLDAIKMLQSLDPSQVITGPDYTFLDIYLNNPNRSINWYKKVESDPSVRQSLGKITHILTDFQFDDELTGHQLLYLESLLKSQKPSQKFGILPAPGQNIKPYTNEFLSLYTLQTINSQVKSILTLSAIDSISLSNLTEDPPFAILITKDNFTSSSDLQAKIDLIKTKLPTTEILISQDSEGHNTIPWINTNARSFFKSTSEAIEATSRKVMALKSLGFTGAIIATSRDQDGYLQAIIVATTPSLTPYILYTDNIPPFATNLVVETNSDLEAVKKAGYPGNLFLLSQN